MCENVTCACRRDSAVIKEEIKSFLANRRISQAVVAQVTGQSELHLHPDRQDLLFGASHLVESQDPKSNRSSCTLISSLPLL